MRHPTAAKCSHCGSPTGERWTDCLDGHVILCSMCRPVVRQPVVHLYGAPDGQEMMRWMR